jgi:hypothetical protein
VFVLDSITGAALPVDDVTVVAIDGAYADTAKFSGTSYLAIRDRPGIYRVEVTSLDSRRGFARMFEWTGRPIAG